MTNSPLFLEDVVADIDKEIGPFEITQEMREQ